MREPSKLETPPETSKNQPILPLKIKQPWICHLTMDLEGTSPYVSNRMSNSARAEMKEKITGGSSATTKKRRVGRDLDVLYRESMHVSTKGWYGIPASGIRKALVDACRLTDCAMTLAKIAVFIEPHGYEADGTPLVEIEGAPEPFEACTVNKDQSPNIVARAMWKKWSVRNLVVRFDRDIFTSHDVANLLERVGAQVGLGAGRYFSQKSTGMGWGLFKPIFISSNDRLK